MENKSDVIATLRPVGVAVGQGQRGLRTLKAALHFFLSFFVTFFSSSLTLKNPVVTLRQTGLFYINIIIICILYCGQRRVFRGYVDNCWVGYVLTV